MELKNGRITILFEHEGLAVEIQDMDAGVTFVRAKLDREQTCKVMSRLAMTPCKMQVVGLDKVGTKQEYQKFEFSLGMQIDLYDYRKQTQLARSEVVKQCPQGWEPDLSFSSRDSFFTKGQELWARTTIRRWV